jgi:type I restriction enzyme S subunit
VNFNFARGAYGTQVLLSKNSRMPQHLFYHSLLKIDLSNYGYARHFKFLKDSKIVSPDEISSKKFEKIATRFFNLIRENRIQNQQLSSLRDWMLPMLMNGQVRVKETEQELQMASEQKVGYGS